MKKNNILYVGNLAESLWAALGYMPFLFIITMTMDKNSIFLKAHGVRSAMFFLFLPIINLPLILVDSNVLPSIIIIYPIYKLVAIFFTFTLLIEYCICIHQAANKVYKKTFLMDRVFGRFFIKYMKYSFFHNDLNDN